MQDGYSILLGETINATDIEYHDCERFQIVCPHCREPVFKAQRMAGRDTPTHYLSHYCADDSYAGDCEMRVETRSKNDVETENRTARDQRLRYFLSVLRRTIGMDPMYTGPVDKSHWPLNKAPGIALLKDICWKQVILPNREIIFDEGVDDYLAFLSSSGWAITTTFSIDMQRRIARDMWMTTCTSAGRSNYEFLFNHAWLGEIASFTRGFSEQQGLDKEVSGNILYYMHALIKAKRSEVEPLLGEAAQRMLPPGYNKLRGREDDQLHHSTYLTRLLGNVAQEMVGALVSLPYFELLKQQYGDSSKTYPLRPGTEPASEEEKRRLAELRAQRSGPSETTH